MWWHSVHKVMSLNVTFEELNCVRTLHLCIEYCIVKLIPLISFGIECGTLIH